jgi:hypothetical protein
MLALVLKSILPHLIGVLFRLRPNNQYHWETIEE